MQLRLIALSALSTVFWVGSASAGIIATFSDFSSFKAATSQNQVVEDFEAQATGKRGQLLDLAQVRIENVVVGSNELFIAPDGQTNFGPDASPSFTANTKVLTGNGADVFDIFFKNPTSAFGFDTYVNSISPGEMVSVFDLNDTLLGAYQISHAANVVGFFGVTANEVIGRVRFDSGGGASLNTGIDNIVTGVVPEPASLSLLLLGFAAGVRARRA